MHKTPIIDPTTGTRLYDVAGGDVFWDPDNGILSDTYALWTEGPGFAQVTNLPFGRYAVKASKVEPSDTPSGLGPNSLSALLERHAGPSVDLSPLRWAGVDYLVPPLTGHKGRANPTAPETVMDVWTTESGIETLTNVRYRPLTLNLTEHSGRSAWIRAGVTADDIHTASIVTRAHVGSSRPALVSIVMPVKVPERAGRIGQRIEG